MSRASVISPYQQFYYPASDNVLAGGNIYFQTATGELARIYSDPDLKTPQVNPYTLDAGGTIRGDVRFPSTVNLVVKSPSGATLYTIENVSCFNDDVYFTIYSSIEIYAQGQIVTASDGNYYQSLIDGNLNNNPLLNDVAWQVVSFIPTGSANVARLPQIGSLIPYFQSMLIGDGTQWALIGLNELMPNFLGGLSTSNAADSDHDITIEQGRCNDSTNTISMGITQLTKRIDATWGAGDNAGGLASGASLSPNTWYHVFVVKTASAVDVMFDSSISCANGIANNGVTHYRRIASVNTNASSNIRGYFQYGDYFYYNVMIQDYNAIGPTTATPTVSSPLGVNCALICQAFIARGTSAGASSYLLVTAIEQADTTPSSTAFTNAAFENTISQQFDTLALINTGLASSIRIHEVSGVSVQTIINTLGYIDTRGQ